MSLDEKTLEELERLERQALLTVADVLNPPLGLQGPAIARAAAQRTLADVFQELVP